MTVKAKVILSIFSVALNVLSAALGYGFMDETTMPFLTKFFCGMVFIATPILVIQLVIQLLQKKSN